MSDYHRFLVCRIQDSFSVSLFGNYVFTDGLTEFVKFLRKHSLDNIGGDLIFADYTSTTVYLHYEKCLFIISLIPELLSDIPNV